MGKRESLLKLNAELRESTFTEEEILEQLEKRDTLICHYKELATEFGTDVAVFLTRMEWRWINNGCQTFYKFQSPCKSARIGDSWEEEVGISSSKLSRILDIVGTRVRSHKKAMELINSGRELNTLVVYKVPHRGACQWYFNEKFFTLLRATLLRRQDMAQSTKHGLGLIHKMTITYSEHTQKEEIEKSEVAKQFEEPNISDETLRAGIERQREKVRNKTNRSLTSQQQEIINEKNGKTMSLDFSVSPSIILQASEKYNVDIEWVKLEAIKFYNKYTNEKPNEKSLDWNLRFLNKWIIDAIGYKKLNEKKYGKSKPRKDAGAERLAGLKELAAPGFAESIADSTLEELGENLQRYYDSIYGDGDSEEN